MQDPHTVWGPDQPGVTGRPYFAARGQMARQLEHLATHCVTLW